MRKSGFTPPKIRWECHKNEFDWLIFSCTNPIFDVPPPHTFLASIWIFDCSPLWKYLWFKRKIEDAISMFQGKTLGGSGCALENSTKTLEYFIESSFQISAKIMVFLFEKGLHLFLSPERLGKTLPKFSSKQSLRIF